MQKRSLASFISPGFLHHHGISNRSLPQLPAWMLFPGHGEVVVEKPENQRDRDNGKDKAGKHELCGNRLVAPGPFRQDRGTRYRGDRPLQDKEQGNSVNGFD